MMATQLPVLYEARLGLGESRFELLASRKSPRAARRAANKVVRERHVGFSKQSMKQIRAMISICAIPNPDDFTTPPDKTSRLSDEQWWLSVGDEKEKGEPPQAAA